MRQTGRGGWGRAGGGLGGCNGKGLWGAPRWPGSPGRWPEQPGSVHETAWSRAFGGTGAPCRERSLGAKGRCLGERVGDKWPRGVVDWHLRPFRNGTFRPSPPPRAHLQTATLPPHVPPTDTAPASFQTALRHRQTRGPSRPRTPPTLATPPSKPSPVTSTPLNRPLRTKHNRDSKKKNTPTLFKSLQVPSIIDAPSMPCCFDCHSHVFHLPPRILLPAQKSRSNTKFPLDCENKFSANYIIMTWK